MAKKTLLDYTYNPDFITIGIFSTLKIYRLAWYINNQMGFDLKMMPVFTWQPQGQTKGFDCLIYNHEDPEGFMQVYLMANRTSNGPVISDPRNLDYLLLVKGQDGQSFIQEMVKEIRGISNIQTAVWLEKLPDKLTTSMFYDLEMFLGTK